MQHSTKGNYRMRYTRRFTGLAAVLLSLGVAAHADTFSGRWDATLDLNGTKIPFRLDIAQNGSNQNGSNVKGTLYNGDEIETTTSAKLQDGQVVLNFDHYLTKIV